MKIYGVFEETKTNVPSDILETFYKEGMVIIPDLLKPDEIQLLTEASEFYFERQKSEAVKNNINLELIGEDDLLRCPLYYDKMFFSSFCLNNTIIGFVKAVLGDNFQLHLQNVILNRPNKQHHQASWHRDIPYQPYLPSRPMAVNAFFCLTKFSESTGSTYLVPGSHRLSNSDVDLDFLEAKKIPLNLEPGGVVLFDSFIWHRAGLNNSNGTRIGVNNIFTTPIIKQQISLPDFLPENYTSDPFEKRVLGYTWSSPKSVNELRLKKMK